MASGDSDHIEVMDSSVSKKTEIGPTGLDDDGNAVLCLNSKKFVSKLNLLNFTCRQV